MKMRLGMAVATWRMRRIITSIRGVASVEFIFVHNYKLSMLAGNHFV
jgi:hypothetical protein